jgi:hypothetical protein
MGIGVADTFSERGCPRTILLSDGVVLTVVGVSARGAGVLRPGCDGFLSSSTPRMARWTEWTSCLSIASGTGYVPPARS